MRVVTESRAVRCERLCSDGSSRVITSNTKKINKDGSITHFSLVLQLIKEIKDLIDQLHLRVKGLQTSTDIDTRFLKRLLTLERILKNVFS